MNKKIAIIINNADFIFDENVGSKYGGAAVVAKNVYQTFLNDFGFLVHVYARSYMKKYANDSLFKISKPINKLLIDIDSQNYDLVLTLSLDGVYRNQFLQVMSKFNSIVSANFLIRPILKSIYKNKLEYQSRVYSNLPKFASFIAMSNRVKNDYVNNLNIPADQIKIIYPGCDVQDIEESLNKSSEVIRLGIVANSSINKGGHLFLLAAGLAKMFGAKFKISMIATKYKKDIFLQLLINLFRLNSICTIYPKQDDMIEFYNNIDCIVLPSRNEAFGLVVLEGMSFGKVPIVSNTAGVSEIIDENCGFIFNRNSVFSLIKSIIDVSMIYCFNYDEYKILSKSAYNVAKKYSWSGFCENLLKK